MFRCSRARLSVDGALLVQLPLHSTYTGTHHCWGVIFLAMPPPQNKKPKKQADRFVFSPAEIASANESTLRGMLFSMNVAMHDIYQSIVAEWPTAKPGEAKPALQDLPRLLKTTRLIPTPLGQRRGTKNPSATPFSQLEGSAKVKAAEVISFIVFLIFLGARATCDPVLSR